MGRSQVKYRTTHGRGRGRAQGDGAGGRSKRKQSSHLRNLDSNAYRFKEHDTQDDEQVADHSTQRRRTQFFAFEEKDSETIGFIPGGYFQSRAIKQWEEKGDVADDDGAIGMLVNSESGEMSSWIFIKVVCGPVQDLNWIASQLKLVSPDIRYRIDPKYCTDLPFEPQDEDERELNHHVAIENSHAATCATVSSKSAQEDDELDFLLNMSTSTSSEVELVPSPPVPLSASLALSKTAAESEQLEEWLDDMLDM